MSLDHEAIRKAYPNVVTTYDTTGAFDKDGKKITLVQSKIDTARTELNTAAASVKYKSDRQAAYPYIGDQLDLLYKDILAGKVDATGEFAKAIKKVKDDNPKP